MKRFRTKKVMMVVLAGAIVLGGAGAALAYFTSTGTGYGNATVGSATNWSVVAASPTGGLLYPGTGLDTVTYTVTNESTGNESLTGTTAALSTDGSGNVLDTNNADAPVVGCLASWFVVTNSDPGTPVDLAANGQYTGGSVTISLTDAAANQDACEGVFPQVTIGAS